MKKSSIKFILLVLCSLFSLTANSKAFSSPNGKLVFNHSNGEDIKITYCGRQVLHIPFVGLNISSSSGVWTYKGISSSGKFKANYKMVSGKKTNCKNTANKYILHYELGSIPVDLVFMLFNDGVTFRYEIKNLKDAKIIDELTTYRIPDGQSRWIQDYDPGYERFFPHSTNGESRSHHWGYPALIEPIHSVYMLITESNIVEYNSSSSLKNEKISTDYKVNPEQNDLAITGEWHSPWRVAIIGSLSTIVESTLVTDVAEPCKIDDTSWIQPGVASWIYWAYNRGSKDFQIVKKYIDMAYTLHLPYVLIDWEWDVMENGGNIDDALAYAKEKGVKVLLWYNSSTGWVTDSNGPNFRLNKPEDREREFTMLENKGVSGVKIDFFAGDNQPTMEYCIGLLEYAARHHLTVNFHGATIPRGWQRTYPNLVSTEAVYGAEWYNNVPTFTDKAASHNCTLPFTRNVVGPMDYTPCAFSDSQHPHITSHAHELALTVVFESAVTHLADRPESLLAQPQEVQDFFTNLPTVWDETRLVTGIVGEFVIMARRSGSTWYVGVLNGTNNHRSVPMSQLRWKSVMKNLGKNVLCFEDSGNKDNPWKISTDSHLPNNLELQPRGGAVYVVKK